LIEGFFGEGHGSRDLPMLAHGERTKTVQLKWYFFSYNCCFVSAFIKRKHHRVIVPEADRIIEYNYSVLYKPLIINI
jgi:hypothetical protein